MPDQANGEVHLCRALGDDHTGLPAHLQAELDLDFLRSQIPGRLHDARKNGPHLVQRLRQRHPCPADDVAAGGEFEIRASEVAIHLEDGGVAAFSVQCHREQLTVAHRTLPHVTGSRSPGAEAFILGHDPHRAQRYDLKDHCRTQQRLITRRNQDNYSERQAVSIGPRPRGMTRAIGEMRRLLAGRGFAVPERPGVRLRTLEDVFAYAQAEGVQLRLDATEAQGRRPAAGRGGRWAFVSGDMTQNTMKATVIADYQGRTLWAHALRPGRMHHATAVRLTGIGRCFEIFDRVQVLLDDGYLGLSRGHRGS